MDLSGNKRYLFLLWDYEIQVENTPTISRPRDDGFLECPRTFLLWHQETTKVWGGVRFSSVYFPTLVYLLMSGLDSQGYIYMCVYLTVNSKSWDMCLTIWTTKRGLFKSFVFPGVKNLGSFVGNIVSLTTEYIQLVLYL